MLPLLDKHYPNICHSPLFARQRDDEPISSLSSGRGGHVLGGRGLQQEANYLIRSSEAHGWQLVDEPHLVTDAHLHMVACNGHQPVARLHLEPAEVVGAALRRSIRKNARPP